jgi:hypothetical protein
MRNRQIAPKSLPGFARLADAAERAKIIVCRASIE